MSNSSTRRLLLLVLTVVLSVQLLWPYSSSSLQVAIKQPPSDPISIVSPADGTVVHPGDTLHIEVSVPTNRSVRAMMILSPLGGSEEMREAPPWSFTLRIPVDDRSIGGGGPLLGKHPIYASAASPGRDAGSEAVIGVDVEMPDLPKKLWSQFSGIFLETIGEEDRIIVSGVFPDGSDLELNESCCLSFSSSDNSVATVNEGGVVRAIRPGHAMITSMYKQAEKYVQLPIPFTFENLILDVTPASLDFPGQSVGTKSQPLQLTVTNVFHSQIELLQPKTEGEFSETDNCVASSPLHEDGGICTVNVVFQPSVAGLRTGKLEIWSNYTTAPTAIYLSGIGR
jgi:hypothetical protein